MQLTEFLEDQVIQTLTIKGPMSLKELQNHLGMREGTHECLNLTLTSLVVFGRVTQGKQNKYQLPKQIQEEGTGPSTSP